MSEDIPQFNLEDFSRIIERGNSVDLCREHSPEDVEVEIGALCGPQSGEERSAVLGIDIKGYSKFDPLQRRLVPAFFRHLLTHVMVKVSEKREKFLFQGVDKDNIQSRFIDTGDGGFLVFRNPLQALAFCLHLQWYNELFASDRLYRNLLRILSKSHHLNEQEGSPQTPFQCRFALAYGEVYRMSFQWGKEGDVVHHNHYGEAIIMCSRMMALDTATRFLCDEGTFDWFQDHTGGFQNLNAVTLEDIAARLGTSAQFDSSDKAHSFFRKSKGDCSGGIEYSTATGGNMEIKGGKKKVYNLYLKASSHADSGDRKGAASVVLGINESDSFFSHGTSRHE